MSDRELLDDPGLRHRMGAYVEGQRQLRAPERLVDVVMADVLTRPRRARRSFRLPRTAGVLAYAALTVAIAIGVTLGILLARAIGPGEVGGPTRPPSSPSPTATASGPGASAPASQPASRPPAPSPAALSNLPAIARTATAIEAGPGTIWAAGPDGLAELDPVSGTELRSVALPRLASDLLLTDDAVWVASEAGPLVRVDRTTLAITEVAAAIGGSLAEADGRIWLGATDEVVAIDPIAATVTRRVPVADRAAGLGIAVLDGVLHVATRTRIARLDAADGGTLGSIPGDASFLVADAGAIWAGRGTELLRIDPASGEMTVVLAGIPAASPMTSSPGRVWIAGPPGGGSGQVVVVDLASGSISHVGTLPGSARTIAVAVEAGAAWVATDEDGTIHRFAVP